MRKLVAPLLALLILMAFVGALADEKDLYIDGNAQKIFTSVDGLLSTSTQAVAQTSEGFIWIGGYGGLVRYDGKRFESIAYKKITRVCDMAAGEDGVLWVATSDKGLFRCFENEFQLIQTEDGDSAMGVPCLVSSPNGTLYLGTDAGLCTVEGNVIRRMDVPGLENERINRLLCPEEGVLLCVTQSGSLYRYDGQDLIKADTEGDYTLRSACWNPADGTYLAGTSGSEVLVFDAQMRQVGLLAMEGISSINDLRCDESGALWLCTDNGIAIYVHDRLRMQNLLMNNSVDRMMVDSEGDYWFVSSRQGVLEVSRSRFGDVSKSAGLDSMVVNAIQCIGDTMYIGHDAGMVTLNIDTFQKTEVEPLAALNNVRVRALLADDAGDLWIGTMRNGLMRYTPGGDVVHYTSRTHPVMRSNNVRSIIPTDDGMLISTDRGAYLISGDEVQNVSNDPDALDFRILCAARFGDTVYLGSDGNGLYLFQDGEIVRHITTDDGLSSNVIMKEYWSDACEGVWLVTGNDIDFLDKDGKITSIANFPSTNNLDLLVMENGDAWVLTGSGIYQTTEESLLRDDEPKYLLFRHMDGVPYEITPNSYQCMTDEMLYVCGSGGVFSLQTDFTSSETGEYQLAIDSVMADGQPVYIRPGEPCEIDANVKRIDINAYVLTYQTGKPFVTYWLEGFDDRRTVAQLNNIGDISYTNLNGGSYTFHYGVVDYRTDEVIQEITIPIVKRYAWYERSEVRLAALRCRIPRLKNLPREKYSRWVTVSFWKTERMLRSRFVRAIKYFLRR